MLAAVLALGSVVGCQDAHGPTVDDQSLSPVDSAALLRTAAGFAAAPATLSQGAAGIMIEAGDVVRVTIISAECASIGDVMSVFGPVSGVVSTNACFDVGASIILGPSPSDGELTFVLDDPRFGSGTFRVSGSFPNFIVEMEDGFGDGDFNDNILSVTITRGCPPSGDIIGAMDSPQVISDLLDALTESNPNGPPGTRQEQGGIIWERPDGSFFAAPVPTINATECLFEGDFAAGASQPPEPGAIAVAKYHTHPQSKGEQTFGCRGRDRRGRRFAQFPGDRGIVPEAEPDAKGGGSDADWTSGTSDGFPMYVITKDGRIYRLDPDTPRSARKNNPNKWETDPAVPGCATRIA